MDTSKSQTILITGGGGFLGNQLAAALLNALDVEIKELVLTDIVEPRYPHGYANDKRITRVTGDVSEQSVIDELFKGREYTAIAAFHGLMSGGSEADFEGGMKANLESTHLLLEKCRKSNYAKAPVFLFTSSGAVYGGLKPGEIVTDDTTPTPQGSYGIQKYICEQLCYDYSRKGWIDARIVRLPTIVVRPGKPNTALSSYASNIVREPLKGNKYPAHTRTCTLPGIKVTTQEILDALAQVAGPDAVKLVEIKPDITVQSITDTWAPEWKTDRAFSLGCKSDKNILDAVVAYKTMLDQGQG